MMTQDGASLPPLLSLLLISALQTHLCLTTMAAGAILLGSTLIWLSLPSSKLPNTELELSLCPLGGNKPVNLGKMFIVHMNSVCENFVPL